MNDIKRSLARSITLTSLLIAPIALLSACDRGDRAEVRSEASTAASNAADAASRTANRVGNAAEDTLVTTKVKSALLADEQVKGTQVEVETNNGTVTLSGSVTNADEKSRAEQIARQTEGVREVRNNVVVAAR